MAQGPRTFVALMTLPSTAFHCQVQSGSSEKRHDHHGNGSLGTGPTEEVSITSVGSGYVASMSDNGTRDLTSALRSKGVRKKLAKRIGKLDGNKRRAGAKGEHRARQAVADLSAAADEIRERVLTGDPKRRTAARKAAQTRKRAAKKRRSSASRGAKTWVKVALRGPVAAEPRSPSSSSWRLAGPLRNQGRRRALSR